MPAEKETEIAYAKLREKIFHNKRHNKRPPCGDEHKPCVNTSCLEISYKFTLFQKKSCFNFDVHIKERNESDIFFCGGRQLENRTEKERSLWFPRAILLLIDGSPTGTE